jgi:hypothetical protein
MKIVLSNDLLIKINQKNLKSLIKIIKLKKASTLISVKGKVLEIPFKLNPKLQYNAEIKNNTLYILENKTKKTLVEKNKDVFEISENVKKNLEKLFFIENKNKFIENEINYLLFNKLYSKINDTRVDKKKYKNFVLKNKKVEDYYFIFTLPYFNKLAKIFIKVDKNKSIFLNIYSEKLNDSENKQFENNLKKIFTGELGGLKLNFYRNKDEFYKNIYAHFDLTKIDIRI